MSMFMLSAGCAEDIDNSGDPAVTPQADIAMLPELGFAAQALDLDACKPPARPFWRGCRVVGQGLGPNDDEAINTA